MRCRKCDRKAVLNMRHHKLALCSDHYLEWFTLQTSRFIKKYAMFGKEGRVLVAVSGGKDSMALWDVLLELGYDASGMYIDLGIGGDGGYSSRSREVVERFAEARGAELFVVDLFKEYGVSVPEMAKSTLRGRRKPCSLCGTVKRHEMNRLALQKGFDVVVTGHNLDDEVSALFGNVLGWRVGYLRRQGPLLPATDGMPAKAKPFCRFYERETAAYALLKGIPFLHEECPFVKGATFVYYKRMLARMEADKPGLKLHFYLEFLKARDGGLFAPEPEEESKRLHPCDACGQPTTAPGTCAFCRILERAAGRVR